MTLITTATAKVWPREYLFRLYRFGPRTFAWMNGTNRVSGTQNFRTVDAAKAFATENGWIVS
jgi:hypothetical protein